MIKNLLKLKRFTKGTSIKQEEPTPIVSLAIEPQSHLEKYLAYYVGRIKPSYAVLVTGDWGTGKTHQVRRALPDTHAHYVSLFGLNSPSEIETQIFSKMFPTNSALKRFAEKIDSTSIQIPVVGALATGGLASLLTGHFIKNEIDSSRPLILDDLERCTVENPVLLGMINRYVEHHGCRVIVIAHDNKVVETFSESKEKIFGQTLHVEPNVDAAFSEFVALFMDSEKPDKLGSHRREVLSTFKESGTSSLRILRHVVEDIGRLADALEDRYFENETAMVELVRLYSALAIETRTNKLEREDLFRRREKIVSRRMDMGGKEKEEPPKCGLYDASQKYTSIDIASTLLSDDVLAEMLFDGRFTENHIRTSLNNSAYFLEKQAARPWQIVSSFDMLDDEEVDPALALMNEQFDKREVTDSGEFLHIVSLKMMMASRGVVAGTSKQIADDAKQYIDDLLAAKRLPPRKVGWLWTDDFKDSFGGVRYWVVDSYRANFNNVVEYLVQARINALADTLPGKVPALLEVVKTDGQKFFGMVCYSRNENLEYQDIPIFAHVDPAAFVDAWLKSPKQGWYWIGKALKERQKVLSHYPGLSAENTWYPKVHKEILARACKQKGLARLRMERTAEFLGISDSADTASPIVASAQDPVQLDASAMIQSTPSGGSDASPRKPKRARRKISK
ncbi:P-loop NTPase fold protein [Agrobacterium sp.]|uniref:P-loop NTPase fold protein n=1 Tax=Agrobacterium sp. TaxID=361 RepID=UPI0028B1CD0E|nr:P-loop NTPase fold protein [Agrobacterium sp.]